MRVNAFRRYSAVVAVMSLGGAASTALAGVKKFEEKFASHRLAPKMAFRVGQCYYKDKQYVKAAESFDRFAKLFHEDALGSDSLFWSGESFRMGNNNPLAFQRYNRCRWDFPSSEAAANALISAECSS